MSRTTYENDSHSGFGSTVFLRELYVKDPAAHRPLARAGRALVESRYGIDVTLPQLWKLFTSVRR